MFASGHSSAARHVRGGRTLAGSPSSLYASLMPTTSTDVVLVVEDDPDVRRSAQVALGYVARIEAIASLESLEGALAATVFDAVLLDMNFVIGERSGAAGLDGLARVRTFDPTLAVVLMTAYGGVTLAVDALKRGAADFVLKPWRNDKLVAAVTAAVQLTRARRKEETLQLDALERSAIERALTRHHGNISSAAAALGISRAALYRRISKHGL